MSVAGWIHARLVQAAVALAAAGGMVVVQVLWSPMEIVTNAPLHVLVWLGAWPRGTPGVTSTYGWGGVPSPPYWFHVLIQNMKRYSWELAVLATAIGVYHLLARWSHARRPRDGITRCGLCGYNLRGLSKPRCPECGTPIGAPIRVTWKGRLTRMFRALACFACCALLFVVLDWSAEAGDSWYETPPSPVSPPPPHVAWRDLSASWHPQTWATLACICRVSLATLFLCVCVCLALYDRLALREAWVPGPTRCGHCGQVLRIVSTCRCPLCGRLF